MQVIKKKKGGTINYLLQKPTAECVHRWASSPIFLKSHLKTLVFCSLWALCLLADDNFISERGPDTVNAKNNLVKRVVNNKGICLLFQILGISQQTWCLQTNNKEAGDSDRTQWIAGCIPPSSDKKQSVLFKIPVRQTETSTWDTI